MISTPMGQFDAEVMDGGLIYMKLHTIAIQTVGKDMTKINKAVVECGGNATTQNGLLMVMFPTKEIAMKFAGIVNENR